ncbi:MAG: hypothetical protein PHG54_03385 [Smithellaceae bacterium]|nr:hypothetical protein [Syntrophaceae bacterium]MDD4240449.1 hypothetical protein [Smithellaceae bacterium]NLX50825.1 hypothetical protein [Deltaproteobacteria bacterium]
MSNNQFIKPTSEGLDSPPLQSETDISAAAAAGAPPDSARQTPAVPGPDGAASSFCAESDDEIVVGGHRIQLAVPRDILKQVKSFNRESANKSAGFWAAQILKKNPQLTLSPQADPVLIWNEIKDHILKRIAL